MPTTQVLFFREGREVPVLDWIEEQPDEAQERLIAAVERLADFGHELRCDSSQVRHDHDEPA
jgi:hypothetical protein